MPESGIEIMVLISGAGFWSVCQGPKAHTEQKQQPPNPEVFISHAQRPVVALQHKITTTC